jgi:hypothetical protein
MSLYNLMLGGQGENDILTAPMRVTFRRLAHLSWDIV